MDDRRFDDLTRALAGGVSRRGFLAGLAAGLAASLGRRRASSLAACPPGQVARSRLGCVCETTGRPPDAGGACPCPAGQVRCGGVCLKTDRDPANCGACGKACPASPDPCLVPVCRNGACGYAPVADGTPCDDGDACTQTDVCQAGVCVGLNPVVCTPLDQCHDAGTCDPATGVCSDPPKPDGTPCDDGDACTQTDVCQAGVCVGLNPVVCTPLDQCHDAGTCDPATGLCSNPPKPNGTPCNDDNACTEGDTCQDGVCQGGQPVSCPDQGPCVTVTCDPIQGCISTPKPQGTSCADSNRCDGDEVCDGAGNCVAGTPVVCGECTVCDPASGTCVPANDGQACTGDGNRCFDRFVCQDGACVGQDPVVCTAADQCHVAGTCEPATGQCSNPAKPNGTACDDGNPCSRSDTCQGGVCVGGDWVVCPRGETCGGGGQAGVCGSSCGSCPAGSYCHNGHCCTPDCRTCQSSIGDPNPCPAPPGACGFDDGCGGVCETCSSCETCTWSPGNPLFGTCVEDTLGDPSNCGECGHVCPSDAPCCMNGGCVSQTCNGVCCGPGEYCCSVLHWGDHCCPLGTTCCPRGQEGGLLWIECCGPGTVCDQDGAETGYWGGCVLTNTYPPTGV